MKIREYLFSVLASTGRNVTGANNHDFFNISDLKAEVG